MSPAGDIRRFAALCARLSDPFTDEAEVLREVGLDAASWTALRARWRAKLEREDAEAAHLAARFGEAYAAERGGAGVVADDEPRVAETEPAATPDRASARGPGTTVDAGTPPSVEGTPVPLPRQEPRAALVPSFLKERPALSSMVAPRGAEPAPAAAPPASIPLGNETTEINLAQILGGRLPFDPSKPSPASVPLVVPKPKGPMSGETTDIDVAALARAALAFRPSPGGPSGGPRTAELPAPPVPPAPPASAANEGPVPGRRLVRFDPKTGTPLATPYWEDVPPPGGHKR